MKKVYKFALIAAAAASFPALADAPSSTEVRPGAATHRVAHRVDRAIDRRVDRAVDSRTDRVRNRHTDRVRDRHIRRHADRRRYYRRVHANQ